jgi:hypothetical protein
MSAEGEISALDKDVEQLQKNTKQFLSQLNSITPLLKQHETLSKQYRALTDRVHKDKSAALDDENKSKLKDINSRLTRLKSDLVPTTGSVFVRLFLGQVNVKVYREDEKLKLKQEYQKFRSRTDLIWVFMSLIQLVIWPDVRALEIIFQIWLLYYYVSISLRENILRVNGSNIRSWWIIHHYLSTVVSLVTLTWPDGPAFRTFIKQNLYMTLAQGVVQILQTRYQQGRLYKLVAMGKATRMDVTGGEHSGFGLEQFTPSLLFLFPFLLSLQCFQLYHGYTLLLRVVQYGVSEWQLPVLGLVFLTVGVGNIVMTLRTYHQKGWSENSKRD